MTTSSSMAPPPPVDSPVYSVESGWTGVVVRHVPGSIEDRPHTVVPVVKWDRNGVETKMRPGRVRVYDLENGVVLSTHDGRLAIRLLKNLVHGEVCSFGMSMAGTRFSNCRDYQTYLQGSPSTQSGCFHCQAVEFLKRIDPSFNPYK